MHSSSGTAKRRRTFESGSCIATAAAAASATLTSTTNADTGTPACGSVAGGETPNEREVGEAENVTLDLRVSALKLEEDSSAAAAVSTRGGSGSGGGRSDEAK